MAEVCVIKFCIVTAAAHQRVVAAFFDDLALLDHDDPIRALNRAEAVGNDNARAPLQNDIQPLLDQRTPLGSTPR